jgi:hypothetical protein
MPVIGPLIDEDSTCMTVPNGPDDLCITLQRITYKRKREN